MTTGSTVNSPDTLRNAVGSSQTSGVSVAKRRFLYRITASAALAGFLFGFDTAVINGGLVFLRRDFSLSEVQVEIVASSLLLGCALGSTIAGWLTDRLGRKQVLILAGILFCATSVGTAISGTLSQFILTRVAGGVAIGIASLLAPIYIAEISPASSRGRLVSLNQLAIVIGILASYLVNWMLSGGGTSSWRLMFGVALLPAALFVASLLSVPESPRWLTANGREHDAARVLDVIGSPAVTAELECIKAALRLEDGRWRALLRPGMRGVMMIGIGLAVLQQACGMNIVIYYGSLILTDRVGHESPQAALAASVLLGFVNLLGTFAALWLIDRVGRRPLLLFSALTMGGAEVLLGVAFVAPRAPTLPVVSLLLVCVGAFAVGLGPCMWALLAELFPTSVRGRAMSVATTALWLTCLAMTGTYLTLSAALGSSGAFWLYAVFCFTAALLVWKLVPETNGRSLEEIEKIWLSSKGGGSVSIEACGASHATDDNKRRGGRG